jgi:hypothetical protein
MKDQTVTITQEEYEEFLETRRWLSALESSGVDKWEGYNEAVELFQST